MSSDKTYHDKNSSKSVFQMANAEMINGFFRMFDVSWIFACIENNSVYCAVISKLKMKDTRYWLIYLVLMHPLAIAWSYLCSINYHLCLNWFHLYGISFKSAKYWHNLSFFRNRMNVLRSKEMKKAHTYSEWKKKLKNNSQMLQHN